LNKIIECKITNKFSLKRKSFYLYICFLGKEKILIRIGSLRHGGAEKVLVTFLKNLPKDKYEIDLLLNLYSGKYLSEVPDWINVLYLNKGEMITTNRIQDIPKKFSCFVSKLLKNFQKFYILPF
jgi:hypothetical protein